MEDQKEIEIKLVAERQEDEELKFEEFHQLKVKDREMVRLPVEGQDEDGEEDKLPVKCENEDKEEVKLAGKCKTEDEEEVKFAVKCRDEEVELAVIDQNQDEEVKLTVESQKQDDELKFEYYLHEPKLEDKEEVKLAVEGQEEDEESFHLFNYFHFWRILPSEAVDLTETRKHDFHFSHTNMDNDTASAETLTTLKNDQLEFTNSKNADTIEDEDQIGPSPDFCLSPVSNREEALLQFSQDEFTNLKNQSDLNLIGSNPQYPKNPTKKIKTRGPELNEPSQDLQINGSKCECNSPALNSEIGGNYKENAILDASNCNYSRTRHFNSVIKSDLPDESYISPNLACPKPTDQTHGYTSFQPKISQSPFQSRITTPTPMPGISTPPPPSGIPTPPPMPGFLTPPPKPGTPAPPLPSENLTPLPLPGISDPTPPSGILTPPPMPRISTPPPSSGIPTPPPLPGILTPPPQPGIPGPSSPRPHEISFMFPLPPSPGISSPPPPPGMPFARKQLIIPKAEMKNLYWSPIRKPIRPAEMNKDAERFETCWEKIDEVKLDDSAWDNFTKLFSKPIDLKKELKEKTENNLSKGDENKKRKRPANTLRPVSVLDYKRQQHVGIFVKSNKLENISEIRNAITEFDTTKVSHEILQQILEIKATNAEIVLLEDHVARNPEIPLDKADKFLFDLNLIPNFKERVACITFQSTFMESLKAADGKLNNFDCVCQKLMKSPELQKILALILTLGNYMNGGNKQRGQADGFDLDILPKLKDLRSNDNSYTFLHYIVGQYITLYDGNLENASTPLPNPVEIGKASELKFDAIRKELMNLRNNMQGCERQTEVVINTSTDDVLEPFKTKMTKFLEQANIKSDEVEEKFAKAKEAFISCMKFFDYIPKKGFEHGDPHDFFPPWKKFCSDFNDIWSYELQQQNAIIENEKAIKRIRTAFRSRVKESNKKLTDEKGVASLCKTSKMVQRSRHQIHQD